MYKFIKTLKRNKIKFIIIALTLVVLSLIMLWIDIKVFNEFNNEPIFAKRFVYSKCPDCARSYYGLGYKIVICGMENNKELHLGFYNINHDVCEKWANAEDAIIHNDYVIVDETEICADALEEIYNDELYVYYLPCIKSGNIYLKYNSGDKIYLRDALEQKQVTIEELIEKGLKVYKEDIN